MSLHIGCDRARVVSSRTLSGRGYEDSGGQMFARVGDLMTVHFRDQCLSSCTWHIVY